MKRVLYIVDGLGFGGTQRYVIDLAKFSSKFDVDPFVCSFVKGDQVKNELLSENIPILAVPVTKVYTREAFGALGKIIRFIKSHKIEVVHTFQTNPNILGTLAGRLAGIPVISSRRDTGELGLRGSWRVVLFERMIINRLVSKIVANSKAAAEAARKNEGIQAGKIQVIYNGIDHAKYSDLIKGFRGEIRANSNLSEDLFVFGNIAVHRTVKSLDTLIRAFKIVHSQHSSTRLLMVGDGPERKNLESLARSLGIFNAVLFTGVNLDVSTILPAMDAFILSSKTESFSNAILEAMAAGLPVIATDVGGNPESVLHGETGLLVPKENPEAMAKAMVELFNNPSKAASMGISGKKRVQIFFSWENSFRNLRNLYFSV